MPHNQINAQKRSIHSVGLVQKSTHLPGGAVTELAAITAAEILTFVFSDRENQFRFQGALGVLNSQFLSYQPRFSELGAVLPQPELDVLRDGFIQVIRHQRSLSLILRRHDQGLILLRAGPMDKDAVAGVIVDLPIQGSARQVLASQAGDFTLSDAHIDGLTGLFSRSGFLKAASRMLSKSAPYDLVVADINRFRRLNEALGHEHADLILMTLAQRLRHDFGDLAVIGRLGEDEFAILTHRGFPRVSDRMRQSLERSISVAGFDICPTFSMGAVSVDGGEQAPEASELLRRAEMAVDLAKSKGVWGVASYRRDLETDSLSRLALETDLRKAFISGEIHAHFQPIITLSTGVIAGFEALARWVHPRLGIIPPDEFLGIARDLGLLNDLAQIMMAHAVKALSHWFKSYNLPQDFFVSVNLSAFEIERPQLVDDVTRLIRDAKLPRMALKLEVTESDIMRDPDASAKVLHALRNAGVGIALDDFGTGFSSLSYLARLPMDTLKIDRSFVKTMQSEATSEKIVRSVLTLGRDLGLDVVAEGVEDMVLAECLGGFGCVLGQGYGFARALPFDAADAFLAKSISQTVQKSA